MYYKSIISNIGDFYKNYKNPKYIIDDWVIVNNEHYLRNKSKINILNGEIFKTKSKLVSSELESSHSQITLLGELKKKYIIIRYNKNFIGIAFSETEYGIMSNEMQLVAVRTELSEDNSDNLPDYSQILKALGYKITRKAKANIDFQISFFDI